MILPHEWIPSAHDIILLSGNAEFLDHENRNTGLAIASQDATTGGRPPTCLEAGMNYDAQHHLAAIFRARAVQQYGAWAPNVPHMYGLPPPDAPVAPLANVGTPLVHVNEGAVSVAADRQIVAGQPHAWLNNAAPTRPVATPPL